MKRALFMVKPSTIQNCLKKAGFVIESLAEVEEILDENDQVSPPSGMKQINFDEFISFDDRTQCYGEQSDMDITRIFQLIENVFLSVFVFFMSISL